VFPSVLQCLSLPKKIAFILQNDLFCVSITFKLMARIFSEIMISECPGRAGVDRWEGHLSNLCVLVVITFFH
jgi:hypothetical protein